MDNRTKKTKKILKKTFIYYLKKKDINQITVSELTKKADLGRGTFYLHYRDTYDIFDDIVNDLYIEIEYLFDSAYPSSNSQNLINLVFSLTNYIEINKELFIILNRPEGSRQLFKKFKSLFTEKILLEENNLNNSKYDKIESMFIVSGVIGVIEEWISKKLKMSQKDLATNLYKVIKKI